MKTDLKQYAVSPEAFRRDLIVDVDGSPKRFGDVMDDWQRADFAALDPALTLAAGRSNEPCRTRAYLERPRGHSKTCDLAVMCCWALAFSSRPLRGYAFAADRDQAALLKDAMATVCRLNPWLGKILDVQKSVVLNIAPGHPGEGGRLEIFASDVASSYGILPDLIIADELCHWEGDGSLWHSLISSAAKRSNCLLAVITNAGFSESWQWDVREAARQDESWIFSRLDGPQASWMTEQRLAEQRRMLPQMAFARLWLNQWSSGLGDAIDEADILAAFKSDLQPMTKRIPGYFYVAGLDLAISRDNAGLIVLAVPDHGKSGRIRLAAHKLWRPLPNRRVDLMEIERFILDLDTKFNPIEHLNFDPWNAELMAQRLEADSNHRRRNSQRMNSAAPWMLEVPPTAANLREQATLMVESFTDHRFELYDCLALKSDFLKLRCEEKSYGIRLVSPRDNTGHGDLASAFMLALQCAHQLAGQQKFKIQSYFGSGPRKPLAERLAEQWSWRQQQHADDADYLAKRTREEAETDPIGTAIRRARCL